jgi:hypothetical protein
MVIMLTTAFLVGVATPSLHACGVRPLVQEAVTTIIVEHGCAEDRLLRLSGR